MSDTRELRVAPTALQAGDTALVNRAGAPAMVAMGSAATAATGDFATAAQGARADTALQPGAQIPWADVTGKPAFAAVAISGAYGDLSGAPGAFSGTAPGLVPSPGTGPADRFLRADGIFAVPPGDGGGGSVGWTDVTDKPTTFPPEAHTHTLAQISDAGQAASRDVGPGAQQVAAGNHTHSAATTSAAGFMSSADKSKLNGIAAGATANATDAQLRDRSTHTGAQAISTVTGLQTALNDKAPTTHTHTIAQVSGLQTALDGMVRGTGITAIELVTAAEHDALSPPDPSTLYVRSDAPPSLAVMDAGGNSNAARPVGAVSVLWINSPTAPANAVAGADLWIEAH